MKSLEVISLKDKWKEFKSFYHLCWIFSLMKIFYKERLDEIESIQKKVKIFKEKL